ncbi:dTDP-4-dehydrorhamnose 3,5-epimerase [bacterium]|nr:dTDP-4-dehydrorhamnose 3,5-epimerase [bacterium]
MQLFKYAEFQFYIFSRGLHYQIRQPQGKLVRVLSGQIWDVVVDVRRRSPTFGKWVGATLSGEDKRMVWVPVGFAHGFLVLSDSADVLYKTTDFYAPEHERCVLWNDPALGIEWPLAGEPIVSGNDRAGKRLGEAELFD